MAANVFNTAKHVATLRFCSTRPDGTQKRMGVYPREQLDIGRDEVKNLLGLEALTISNHHLRFRCVVYEEDNEHDIAPLIYFRVLSFNSVELKRTVAGHNTSVVVSRGHGDILLSARDVLQLTPEVYLQFEYDSSIELYDALDSLQRAEAKCFAKQFLLTGRRLGVGGQASVYVAVKQNSNRQFACKALPLPQTQERSYGDHGRNLRLTTAQRETKLLKARKDLAREYAILEKLDHPNVVSLEKVICATHNIYIFQELITGGDLSSYLDQKAPLPEPEAASIALQLLKAVDYLHSNGYSHRDIKPENILLTSWREGTRVVLTDFGQARSVDDVNAAHSSAKVLRMQSIVGTYGYNAPEIFLQMRESVNQKGYSKAVDIWSIGCVTAVLLTGEALFSQDVDDFTIAQDPPSESECRKGWNVNVIDNKRQWSYVSRKAKGFVKGCLAKDEGQRLTARQALLHDWFTNRHYASELAAAYERAIADSQPRKQQGSLIEFIDTAMAVSGISKRPAPKANAAELKSKHFQTSQKAVALTTPAVQKDMHAHPPRRQPTPQPAMSRDAKEASLTIPSLSRHNLDPSMLNSPSTAGDSMLSSTYVTNASTGPLSIWQHTPPQTQYTVQLQQLFYLPDSVAQSQQVLGDPTQTQLTLPANTVNFAYNNERVVDAQKTQVHSTVGRSDRPRKKVCR